MKREPLYTTGKSVICVATVKISMEVPKKVKIDLPGDLALLATLGLYSKNCKSVYHRET